MQPPESFEDLRDQANIMLWADALMRIRESELDAFYGPAHPHRPAPLTEQQAMRWAAEQWPVIKAGGLPSWPSLTLEES